MKGFSTMHPGLSVFAQRRGVSTQSWRDGGLTLLVDGRHRLQFRPDINGRVALSARIAELPAEPGDRERDRWLERMTRVAAGLLRDSAATLCIDGALYLQQSLAADLSAEDIAIEVGTFVNVLEFWIREGQKE